MYIFSINTKAGERMTEIWNCIQANADLFKYYNHGRYEEAMHAAFARALTSVKDNCTDITPYIKALARTELEQTRKDSPYSVTNVETGEVAKQFMSLTVKPNVVDIEAENRIKALLRDLYLEYPDDVLAIRPLLEYGQLINDDLELSSEELQRLKNTDVWVTLSSLYKRAEGMTVYRAFVQFYDELNTERKHEITAVDVKELTVVPANYSNAQKLPSTDTVMIVSGKYSGETAGIDKKALAMPEHINLDIMLWKPISRSKPDIYKIDISEYITYCYEKIFVAKGVDTPMIKWAGERYKLITPGNYSLLNHDRDKFIDLCKQELILNLIAGGVNTIIGITDDNLYVKPTRKITYSSIRLKIVGNKIIDLPVYYYTNKLVASLMATAQ